MNRIFNFKLVCPSENTVFFSSNIETLVSLIQQEHTVKCNNGAHADEKEKLFSVLYLDFLYWNSRHERSYLLLTQSKRHIEKDQQASYYT